MNGDDHAVVGLGWGISAAYIAAHALGYGPLAVAVAPISWLSAKIPDIDHDKTKIGRKRKAVTEASSKLISAGIISGVVAGSALIIATGMELVNTTVNTTGIIAGVIGLIGFSILRKFIKNSESFKWATKHRGIMHTLLVPALLAILIYSIPLKVIRTILIGVEVGYVSHLFADMLTIEGCPILFPLTKASIRILKLTTSDYKKDKRGRRVKKKVDSCKVAAYAVAAISIILSLIFF